MADNKDSENEFGDNDEYQFESDDMFHFDDDDDEFQFSDNDEELTEHDDDDENEEKLSTSPLDYANQYINKLKQEGLKENIVPVVIGAFVVLILMFSIYKLIATFISSPTETTAASQISTATEQQAKSSAAIDGASQDVTTIETIQSIPETSPSVSPTTTVTVAEPEQMLNIQEKITELNEKIRQMEKTNETLIQSVTALQKENTTNIARMDSLAKGITAIQSQVVTVNNTLKKILEAAEKEPGVVPASQPSPIMQKQASYPASTERFENLPVPLGEGLRKDNYQPGQSSVKTYHVQAIIPGQAWLKDNSGKIYNVSVGDIIPGYGRIVAINPDDGYVLTDKGTKIEYGIDQF